MMDVTYKAVLTGMTVAAVLLLARLLGRRAAGLFAGLPVITVPALMWLAHEQGIDFAARSAVGSLVACVMAPWFAATFLVLARHLGPLPSLAGAAALAGLLVVLLNSLHDHPGVLLLLALASGFLVMSQMGASAAEQVAPPSQLRFGEPWITATLAAGVSVGVCHLALGLGPYWAGVLSTLPLISACALVHLRLVAGPSALGGFVSGYAGGVVAKAVFVYSFANAAPHWGTQRALLLAAVLGAVTAWGQARWRRARPALVQSTAASQ